MFQNKKSSLHVKTGSQATEADFKALSGNSPKVIHISTHGFFYPDIEPTKGDLSRSGEPTFKYIENPLFRSGLAFAGSNYAWQRGYNPYEEEDGILTAYEISTLDLSNTDLVVLSACETGLGEIKGSEGVFGLQRAFKMAGVEYVLMSLWKIPDEQTVELMEAFYENWLGGQTIRQAFHNAQQQMAEEYPPYYWAGFTLLGGGKEEDWKVKDDSWVKSYWLMGLMGAGILLISGLLLQGVLRKGEA